MKRIFLTLAVLSTFLLLASLVMGWLIDLPADDPRARGADPWIDYHILTALGALVFASLVHAIVLTYFMGTGRWMEETGQAYRLPDHWQSEGRRLKYRTIPAMIGAFLLLLATGALGAAADPASPVDAGGAGLSGADVHLLVALLTLAVNLAVNVWEYVAIHRNGELVRQVLEEVGRIRRERGLPV